jgi:hypothetical protein
MAAKMTHPKFDPTKPDTLRSVLKKFSLKEDDAVRERQAALFVPSVKADRTKGRVVPMKVLNLGMPRTGTMSMQRALDILGCKCYHSSVFFSQIDDCEIWDAALDAKFFGKGPKFTTAEQWDTVLGEYSAVSADVPPIAFAEELVYAYPDAKVILVNRDVDEWAKSFSNTVTSGMYSPLMHRLADWDPAWLGHMRDTHMRWSRGWFKVDSKEEQDAISPQMFKNHYDLVRRVTPKERLLEYTMGDGWEPLCKFLGKEVPDCPFPHVNDSDAVWEQMAIIARRGLRNAMWRLVRLGGIGLVTSVVAWWVWSSMQR